MSDGPVEIPQGLENSGPPSHEEYIPPAVSSDDNSTEEYGQVSSDSEENNSEGTGKTGYNPAWKPIYEKIPEPFHKEISPFLSEWDKNFEKVQSQFAPYKSFVDNGIAPEAINNSLQLAQLINANPRLVYDQLGERFGFARGQGQEEVDGEEGEDNEGAEEGDYGNPLDDPKLKPFIERQQQMEQYLQQKEQEEQERQLDISIQNEWNAIEKSHGSRIPEDIKTEMIQRAIWIADEKGTEPSLKEGYDAYNAFVSRVRGQKANSTAPQVFGGNGGLPSSPNGITAKMSDQERIDYIAERARILNESNN